MLVVVWCLLCLVDLLGLCWLSFRKEETTNTNKQHFCGGDIVSTPWMLDSLPLQFVF